MARKRARGTERARLDRTRIAHAALLVADRTGFDGVTIRAIAGELGAAPMSIYRHVASKEALLDLMFEEALRRLAPPPSPRGAWRDVLEETARHARALLLAHPAWLALFTRVSLPIAALGS